MKTELRFSRYNHMVELKKDEEWGIINLLTMANQRFNIFQKDLFDHVLEEPESKLARRLKKLGFLVDYDEIEAYRSAHKYSTAYVGTFGITICPTLACNFRCPYCFEDHVGGAMSREIQDQLFEFVKKYMEMSNARDLNVSWFGGEPLLEPEIIKSLTIRFKELCKEKNIPYAASIVTNGYLLSPQMMDMLNDCNVNSVQVTLDGMKENNDKTRILANGDGSFDTITENLKNIRTKAKISVRLNSNKENAGDLAALSKYMKEIAKISGNNITTYAAHMDAVGDVSDAVLDKAIGMEDFYENEAAKGKSVHFKLKKTNYMGCGFGRLYSFAVDSKGNLYKCWNYVGKDKYVVGNIFDKGNIIMEQAFTLDGSDALGYDVTTDSECAECKVLPQCNGGCRYIRNSEGKAGVCKKEPMLRELDKIVINYFEELEEQKKKTE